MFIEIQYQLPAPAEYDELWSQDIVC